MTKNQKHAYKPWFIGMGIVPGYEYWALNGKGGNKHLWIIGLKSKQSQISQLTGILVDLEWLFRETFQLSQAFCLLRGCVGCTRSALCLDQQLLFDRGCKLVKTSQYYVSYFQTIVTTVFGHWIKLFIIYFDINLIQSKSRSRF